MLGTHLVTTPKNKNTKTEHQAPKLELHLDIVHAILYTKFQSNPLRNERDIAVLSLLLKLYVIFRFVKSRAKHNKRIRKRPPFHPLWRLLRSYRNRATVPVCSIRRRNPLERRTVTSVATSRR